MIKLRVMKKEFSKKKLKLTTLIVGSIMSIIIAPKYFNNHHAIGQPTLNGTVVDRNRNPQPFFRVEIEGPSGQFTRFTDENGKFYIDLNRKGRYTIKVTQGRNVKIFNIQVDNLQEEEEFVINF